MPARLTTRTRESGLLADAARLDLLGVALLFTWFGWSALTAHTVGADPGPVLGLIAGSAVVLIVACW
ncbi:MAG: hypothetical protein ACRELX_07950, partial [Longimicrobiales bacterium]